MRLQNKVAIVTGAGQGIGQAIALKFVAEGACVVALDRQVGAVQSLADQINDKGGKALALGVDTTNRAAVDAAVARAIEHFGAVDVLVNNAGITADSQFKKMTEEQLDRVLNVNIKGVFNCAQAVTEHMISRGRGVILNASSVSGLVGNFGQTNYCASKFAVIGMTKTWALELGPKGIRCNAVCPGFINTPMVATIPEKVIEGMKSRIALRRMGQPEEVANLYAFLASDEASYINGAVIEITGGMGL